MSLGSRYVSSLHTGYLKVFDLEGLPYVDAVADLFHYGHTNFFQKARACRIPAGDSQNPVPGSAGPR